MTKVTLPDPVATARRTSSAVTYKHKTSLGLKIGENYLITTVQAEAYADARVREALEEAACVSENGESETQTRGQGNLDSSNHIADVGKMVVPYGYRLVSLADIETAIQRASVFDDGGDGADPESARSCIEILKGMIAVPDDQGDFVLYDAVSHLAKEKTIEQHQA